MITKERTPGMQLLHAINRERMIAIERLLLLPELSKLSEIFVKAAERAGNGQIVACILDHILKNGLDVDHGYPTNIHWALAKRFEIAAELLACIITAEDIVATDENGKTAQDIAEELGYNYISDIIFMTNESK